MKRILFSFIVCLCYALSLSAQTNSAKFLGEIDGSYFIWEVRNGKKGGLNPSIDHFILKFDQSMKLISSGRFETAPAKGNQIAQINKIGDKFVAISIDLNTKKKTLSISLQEINPITLELDGQKKVLTELYLHKDKSANFATFKYAWSDDCTKFLIIRETLPKLFKAVPKTFEVSVFDQEAQLIWTRKDTLSVTDKKFWLIDYEISNKGDVNITGSTEYDKDTLQSNLLSNYLFLEYKGNGKKFEVRNLGLEIANYLIIGEHMKFTEDKIIAAGFYQIPEEKKQYGYFMQTYNLGNLKREKNYYSTLTQEPETDFDDENDPEPKAKGGDEWFAFDIKKLRLDQSGNIFLIGEQRKTVTSYTNNKPNTRESFLDIYALKLDPQGKLIWEKRIPKRQVFTPTATKNSENIYDFASFSISVWNDNLLFLLNENPENLEPGITKPKKVDWKDALSMIVIIDKDGKVHRKVFSNIPGNLIYTGFLYNLSNDKILVRSSQFKEYEESEYKIIDLNQFIKE